MATDVPARPRTTRQSLRISVLLLLVTVGVPGFLTGTAARSSSTAPRPSTAEAERLACPPPATHDGAGDGPAQPAGRAGQAGTEPARIPEFVAQTGPDAYPGRPGAAGGPGATAGPGTPSAGSREQAAPPRTADELPPGYRRSLAYSGLFGLVISVVGLAMIGRRRRLW